MCRGRHWAGSMDRGKLAAAGETPTKDRCNPTFSGGRDSFNTGMNRAKHLGLATVAGDAHGAPSTIRVMPGPENADPAWHIQRQAVDRRVALLEEDLLKLRKRCRAHELALARMAGALTTVRRANRALSDENRLLREQVGPLNQRVSSRAVALESGSAASGA